MSQEQRNLKQNDNIFINVFHLIIYSLHLALFVSNIIELLQKEVDPNYILDDGYILLHHLMSEFSVKSKRVIQIFQLIIDHEVKRHTLDDDFY